MIHHGFEPFYDKKSRVLILGSFPSVKSRENGFYYGNKQNRFFKMLSKLFNEEIDDDVSSKKDFLKRHGIALFDVVAECEINGSSDGDIKNYKAAQITSVLENTSVEKILLNGTKAYSIFKKHYPDLNGILMPSTSPANAAYDYEKWARELSFLKTGN
ncbi:MAG: DNA-deoxyinosine glycosylase [Clostridiales bacterium]|nr:DNA-deoxyinosine glycosylase [Clostridiales bacterium]